MIFSNRFQKTGFIYSLTLSFIYLPLLLGILETNQFIEYKFVNLIVFIMFSITFITTVNYKIILASSKKNGFFVNIYLLAPLNILLMMLTYFILPLSIAENVFIFSLISLGIPWLVFFRGILKRHIRSLNKLGYKDTLFYQAPYLHN